MAQRPLSTPITFDPNLPFSEKPKETKAPIPSLSALKRQAKREWKRATKENKAKVQLLKMLTATIEVREANISLQGEIAQKWESR